MYLLIYVKVHPLVSGDLPIEDIKELAGITDIPTQDF